jgi:hypothetical protein
MSESYFELPLESSVLDHDLWPVVEGPERDRRGRFTRRFYVPAVWLGKTGRREENRGWRLETLFQSACFSYEQIHGERAENDFRPFEGEPF